MAAFVGCDSQTQLGETASFKVFLAEAATLSG